MKYKQGKYKPKNPKKYKGDPTQIFYRSGWEQRLFIYLDQSEHVIWWQSEEQVVPYISPVDNCQHRYFPDVLAHMKTKNGEKTYLIEVKPKGQCKPPKQPKKITKRYVEEVFEFGKNTAKWEAAIEVCKEKGWEFMILTEDQLCPAKPK